jgi:chromosome segregation ATPase
MTAQAMSDAVKTSEEKDITINELLRRLDDLSLELQEKDTTLRMSQNQQSIIEELKQKCESLEKDIMENKSVIEAFTEEGRILAKKQSDLEKINRKIKEMLKKKDMELESVKSLHSEPSYQESLKFSDEVAVAKAELTSTQLKLSSSEGEKLGLQEEMTRLRNHLEFMVNFMILI